MYKVPTKGIISSVLCLKIGNVSANPGSGVFIQLGDFFGIITAKHLVEGIKNGHEVSIFILHNNKWIEEKATPFFSDDEVDIAILNTYRKIFDTRLLDPQIELSSQNLVFGQDVYFLGFPNFNEYIKFQYPLNNDYFPIPFIKKAFCMNVNNNRIYLDGHNNPGFSGGPVFFYEHNTNKKKICGIISGYLNESKKISLKYNDDKDALALCSENSGIILSYDIKKVFTLIDQIPKL